MEDIHKEVNEKLEALVLELFPDGAQVTSTYFDYVISSEIVDALEEYELERKENTQFFTKIKQHISTFAKDKGVIR